MNKLHFRLQIVSFGSKSGAFPRATESFHESSSIAGMCDASTASIMLHLTFEGVTIDFDCFTGLLAIRESYPLVEHRMY
jgi:hypothetical protein